MSDFSKPQPVTDAKLAFPASVSHLMPAMEDIPIEFKRFDPRHKWLRFQGDWFFSGIQDLKITPKDGIDELAAMRHLTCIQGSFEPKHEHKTAAVAYLASLWFKDVTYTTVKEGR